jgi:hypothetical protein
MRRGAIVEVDDAVGEGFGGEEFEADRAMARLNPRPNANLANSAQSHPAIANATPSY